MKILVSGVNGFIGKNLQAHLEEMGLTILIYKRKTSSSELLSILNQVDFIFHLAGINRPKNEKEYEVGNVKTTKQICDLIIKTGRKIPILFTSSIQASINNLYGRSKLAAEQVLERYHVETGSPVYIYRLSNVFGKWSRPNYNSVVATFCYNTINNIPLKIDDPEVTINLVYIDDVIADFIKIFKKIPKGIFKLNVLPIYKIKIGILAKKIQSFKDSRNSLYVDFVGNGLIRALYATYLSFLKPKNFFYELNQHLDSRGKFVEIIKTKKSGQFSFFSANPGEIRGGHYHHTKNEKFLVVQGDAVFNFKNLLTKETFQIYVNGNEPKVVETVPGWAHNIKNIGKETLLVFLWANEVFSYKKTDTIQFKI